MRQQTEDQVKEALSKGEAIGEKRGKAEAEKEFVKALLTSGMSAEEIAGRLKRDITEIRSMLE